MRRNLSPNFVLWILLIVELPQASFVSRESYAAAQMKGRVNGRVLDLNGDPIAFALISISGQTVSKELAADKNGGFEIELPVGVYRATANVEGFAPFRRASFRIQHARTKVLNLVLTLGGIECEIGSQADPEKDGNGPPRYDDVSLSQVSEGRQELLVRFRLKQHRNGIVEYRGGSVESRVMVSYDVLAIYAEKVRVDKNKGIVEAEGRVIVEDGQRRKRAEYARLAVQSGNVLLTTDRGSK